MLLLQAYSLGCPASLLLRLVSSLCVLIREESFIDLGIEQMNPVKALKIPATCRHVYVPPLSFSLLVNINANTDFGRVGVVTLV